RAAPPGPPRGARAGDRRVSRRRGAGAGRGRAARRVIAVAATIAAATAVGVWAERRWGAFAQTTSRRLLVGALYTLSPFVTFFNVARLHVDANIAEGLALGIVMLVLVGGTAWFVGARLLRLERPQQGSLTAPVAGAIVLRLLVAPAVLLALAAPLVRLPDAYLLMAAMPTGINTLVVAHVYGLDLRIAAGAIAWSTTIVVAAGVAVALLT